MIPYTFIVFTLVGPIKYTLDYIQNGEFPSFCLKNEKDNFVICSILGRKVQDDKGICFIFRIQGTPYNYLTDEEHFAIDNAINYLQKNYKSEV